MAPGVDADGKSKRRRVKQMEGLLQISRQEVLAHKAPRWGKPRTVRMKLQPQQLQLVYAAQEDREMRELLGRIDLHGANLEQAPDGFIVTDETRAKTFKLYDQDQATLDTWFFAIHSTIAETENTVIEMLPGEQGLVSAAVTASFRDEITEVTEFELTCQLSLPSHAFGEAGIQWNAWKSADDLQLFDEQLRVSHAVAPKLRGIAFPKERKRDALFGGTKKKQEARQQQVAVYVQHIFSLNELSTDAWTADIVKRFLHFDWFFDVHERDSEQSDQAPNSLLDSKALRRQQSRSRKSSSSRSIDQDGAEDRSRPRSRQSSSSRSLDLDSSDERPRSHSRKSSSSRSVDKQFTDEPLSSSFAHASGAILREPETAKQSVVGGINASNENGTFADIEPEYDPSAAKRLHKQIIRIVRDIVSGDDGRVREFQDETKDFGQGRCTASEYCAFLVGELGTQNFTQLIPMMARLLTIDEKRHELLHAHAAILERKKRRERKRPKHYSESSVVSRTEAMHSAWELIAPRARPKSESFMITSFAHAATTIQDTASARQEVMQPHSWVQQTTESSNSSFNGGVIAHVDDTRHVERQASQTSFGESHGYQTYRGSQASQVSQVSNGTFGTAHGSEEQPKEIQPVLHEPIFPVEQPAADSGVDTKALPPVFRRISINENGWINRSRSSQGSYGRRAERESYGSRNGQRSQKGSQKDRDFTMEDQYTLADNPADDQPMEQNPVLERLKRQGAVNFMLS